ncbi:MAG: HAD hydrolase family protein, partial [Clostridia bacterium]|nr:HAD hydrolase family protein [Clostridia bacterium]
MQAKPRIRLIGLDIDGTLLNSEKRVTPRTASAIRRAAEAGAAVAYVTGRPLSGVISCGILTEGVRYVITSNGAMTYDLSDGAALRVRSIPKGDAKRIARIPMARGLIHSVFAGGCGHCEPRFYDMLMARYTGTRYFAYMRATERIVDDLAAFIDETPDS